VLIYMYIHARAHMYVYTCVYILYSVNGNSLQTVILVSLLQDKQWYALYAPYKF